MSNTRYMEPVIKRLFDLVKRDAPQDEQQAKQMADEAKEYIEAIQQLEQYRKIAYQRLSKKIKLDNGASLETTDENGATFLTWVCQKGHTLIVQALLAANVSPDKAYENNGITPLLFAIKNNHSSVAQTLLTAKADPDKANEKTGETVLSWTAYEGHTQMTQALLIAGADPNKTDEDGATPLYWAAKKAHISTLQSLLSAKANPDRATEKGITALSAAAEEGHLQIIQTLLKAKADPNAAVKNGGTPLTWACEKGYVQIIQALLEAKADPDKINEKVGATPLIFATFFNAHTDAVEVLLQAGAKIDIPIKDGTRALDYATSKKNLEMISLLLKEQASICNPKKLIEFLLSYDPRDPAVLFCLNVLSKQQNNLRNLKITDANVLSDDDYQAMEKYRNELSKVSEKLGREALNESIGKIVPSTIINMIAKLDTPLYRLNDSPTLFSNKKEVEDFREEITKKYKESCP